MTMITPSYLGETIEYSSLHACRSTLEDPTALCGSSSMSGMRSWSFRNVLSISNSPTSTASPLNPLPPPTLPHRPTGLSVRFLPCSRAEPLRTPIPKARRNSSSSLPAAMTTSPCRIFRRSSRRLANSGGPAVWLVGITLTAAFSLLNSMPVYGIRPPRHI